MLLKGPITTPQGGGYKSLTVTLRRALGLFANVRPCCSLHPCVPSRRSEMGLLIVRENEEGTYVGIEHRQTAELTQCLKLISRPGTERLVCCAFELARLQGRRKVTCMTKDYIMKVTDGLFHRVFDEIAVAYPDIEAQHLTTSLRPLRSVCRAPAMLGERLKRLAEGFARDPLHRPLAVPLPGTRRRFCLAGRSAGTARPVQPCRRRLHQDRASLHVRRRTGLLAGPGQVSRAPVLRRDCRFGAVPLRMY